MSQIHTNVFMNEKFLTSDKASVSILDRGFLFADGVYEVISIKNGKLFLMEEHIKRLEQSLRAIDIPTLNVDLNRVGFELIKLNQLNNDAILYIQVTRGTHTNRGHVFTSTLEPTVVCFTQDATMPTYDDLKVGFKAITSEDIRWGRCDIKSIALLPNTLLKTKAHKQGALECILHKDGLVTEGTASNVFIVKDSVVYTTPDSQQILPGITKNYIRNILAKANIPLKEKQISLEELQNADEIWISSTTRDITPIVDLDGKQVGSGQPGKLWESAIQLFTQGT